MKKIDLTRYAPPGIKLKHEKQFIITGFVLALVFSLQFLINFSSATSNLYVYHGTKRAMVPGAVMPDFHIVLDNVLFMFFVYAVCVLLFIVAHYVYHYRGSKSINLMRRLPSRWELHRRCLTIPLVASLMYLLSALVMLFVYYGVYMIFTPEECLAPDQLQKLWSVIL